MYVNVANRNGLVNWVSKHYLITFTGREVCKLCLRLPSLPLLPSVQDIEIR